MNTATPSRVPVAAAWLGGLGVVPFVVLTFAASLDAPFAPQIATVLVAYGACILAFLGGIHWGLAIAAPPPVHESLLWQRLAIGVSPSLAAWAALLLPAAASLFPLAAAFATMLWLDVGMTRRGEAPAWFARLRVPLSLVVISCLLIAGLA
jgi:hypothetical protein